MAKTKTKPVPETTLDDGTLLVRLVGGANDGKAIQLDLIVVKLAFEQVETKHNVTAGFTATAPFLTDLAKAAEGAGVTGCTLTQAFQLWWEVARRWSDLKKKHALAAQVAWRFGTGHKLTRGERVGYYANIPKLKAQDRLERGDIGGLDYDQYYNLHLLAYENPAEAVRARTKFLEAFVQRTCQPK